jgi:hypothetical protein
MSANCIESSLKAVTGVHEEHGGAEHQKEKAQVHQVSHGFDSPRYQDARAILIPSCGNLGVRAGASKFRHANENTAQRHRTGDYISQGSGLTIFT